MGTKHQNRPRRRIVARDLIGPGLWALYIGLWVGLLLAGHDWAWLGIVFLPDIATAVLMWKDDEQAKACEWREEAVQDEALDGSIVELGE